MKNKKIIFAIILFLFIGLTVFTFAQAPENSREGEAMTLPDSARMASHSEWPVQRFLPRMQELNSCRERPRATEREIRSTPESSPSRAT